MTPTQSAAVKSFGHFTFMVYPLLHVSHTIPCANASFEGLFGVELKSGRWGVPLVRRDRLASGEAWLQRPADTPPVDSSPVEVCIQADWQIIRRGPNKSLGSRRGFCAEQFAYTRSELVFQADSVAWAGSPGAAKRSRFVWLLSLQSGLPSSADRLSSKPRIHSRIFTRNTSSFGRGGERADSRLTVRGQCFSCSTQVGF